MEPVDRLDAFLDDAAPKLVEAYLEEDEEGRPLFTGSWFEQVGGGGDGEDVADVFTEADLVAVTMLSVQVGARAAIRILGPESESLSDLLREVPHEASPADKMGQAALRDPDSAAGELWERLKRLPTVGWVTANKLLARKRPALLPVYDSVVRRAVGAPQSWWGTIADFFADQDRIERLEQVCRDADAEKRLSLLRTLDVAVWMRQRGARYLPAGRDAPEPLALD